MQSVLLFLIGAAGALVLFRIGSRLRGGIAGSTGTNAAIAEVDAAAAAELIRDKKAVVFDVRTSAEYDSGRIPKAAHIPLRQLPQRLDDLKKYKDRPIVVSCRTGSRSASACAYLADNGFEEVYNLKGGLRAWARARQRLEN